MLFRIVLISSALLAAYFLYQSTMQSYLKFNLSRAPAGYAIEADKDATPVVEFIDYTCDTCRKLHPALMQAMREDGHIRLIPLPVQSRNKTSGMLAGKLVYAAGRQGRFIDAHMMLIEYQDVINDKTITDVALALKLDEQRLRQDLNDPKIEQNLYNNLKSHHDLGGTHLPLLVLNNNMVVNITGEAPDTKGLLELIEKARSIKTPLTFKRP